MKTSLVSLALIAASAFAQGPPPRGGHANVAGRVSTMSTILSLSSAQQTQVTKIYTDAQAASKTVNTNMHTARTSLNAAVKKNDIGSIELLSQQIGTYEGQMTSINSKAQAAFYATLTPEQQVKADTLHMNGAGFGFGGPGGGGGGPRGPRPVDK